MSHQPFDFRAYIKKVASMDDPLQELNAFFVDGIPYSDHFDGCMKKGEEVLQRIFTEEEVMTITMQAAGSIVAHLSHNTKVDSQKMLRLCMTPEFSALAVSLFFYFIGLSNKEDIY